MDKSFRKDQHGGRLPAPYINPWALLRRDIRAIWVDFKLRIRELWRLNRNGELQMETLFTPRFVIISMLFLIFSLTIVIFLGVYVNDYRINIDDLPIDKEVVLMESSNINNKKILETKESSDNLHQEDSIQEVVSDQADESLKEMLPIFNELGVSDGVFISADMTSIDNGLILTLSEKWRAIDITKKNDIGEKLHQKVEEMGFNELQLKDKHGHLLARTSRIGHGLIILGEYS